MIVIVQWLYSDDLQTMEVPRHTVHGALGL